MTRLYRLGALLLFSGLVACGFAPEAATPTPEIFIPRTQAIPADVDLNGVRLRVIGAALDDHFPPGCQGAEPLCAAAPEGSRFLAVSLAPVAAEADALDYQRLPAGLAVAIEAADPAPYDGRYTYSPDVQRLTLGFEVPAGARVFGLQWPGAAEIPLNVQP